jgi:hypothetical protein
MGLCPHFGQGDVKSSNALFLWFIKIYSMKKAKNEANIKTIVVKPPVSRPIMNNTTR